MLLGQLRELLAAIESRELPAGPTYRHRVEGGITALEAVPARRTGDLPGAAGPGIYRIRLSDPGGSSAYCYVGQSDNLHRRGSSYRSPGPTPGTSLRINEIIEITLGTGEPVTIELATGADVHTATGSEPLDLTVKEHRMLAEQAALFATRLDPSVRLLNR